MEFSKKVVMFSLGFFFSCVAISYALAWNKLDPNSTVTVAIISQCITVCLGYFTYQGYLKNSRNINKIDEKGIPFDIKEEK